MQKLAIAAVTWCFLVVSGSSAVPSEPPSPENYPSSQAAVLMNEAYTLNQQVRNPSAQIRFLGDLVIASPDIVPEKVEGWSRELVKLSRAAKDEILEPWDKVTNQKLAVVALSKTDPVAAMQLFSDIGPPQPNREGRLPEDVRAFGARVLFLNYFRAVGVSSLPRIQKEAENLVSTKGAYPFHAISLVIGELAGSGSNGPNQVNELFGDALKSYKSHSCDSPVENQDSEFLTLLQNTKAVVRKSLLMDAVHQLADHLQDSRCNKDPSSDQFVAIIQTDRGTVRLADQRKTLLFRAFPVINEIDPIYAKHLQEAVPELANANATILQVGGAKVTPNGNVNPEEEAKRVQGGLQSSLLRGVRIVRESNPQAALQMAESLNNKEDRIVAVSSVLPKLAQSDLQHAKLLYNNALNELDSLESPENRQRAAIWIAEAAFLTGDVDNFKYFAGKAFSDGLQQFEKSYTSSATSFVEDRPGYKELSELVEFAAAHDISWPLDEVQQMSNIELKAYLMLSAAKGLSHR
jgi:hypothetical protein